MKFSDLLNLTPEPQTLEELHEKAQNIAVLASRTTSALTSEYKADADALLEERTNTATATLSAACDGANEDIGNVLQDGLSGTANAYDDALQALYDKEGESQTRQGAERDSCLAQMLEARDIPPQPLAVLREALEFNPLSSAFSPAPNALPFKFRVCTRGNEAYGAENAVSTLAETPENFYALLTGAADYTYHSDFEPDAARFLQGEAGSFVYTKESVGYHSFTTFSQRGTGYDYTSVYNYPITPMAAIGAFMLINPSDADVAFDLPFALSSHKFAKVYVNTSGTWTTLYSTTSRLESISQTVSVAVPAQQTVTVLLVGTPYIYRYLSRTEVVPSTSERGDPTYYTYYYVQTCQFTQLAIYNLRNILASTGLQWGVLNAA